MVIDAGKVGLGVLQPVLVVRWKAGVELPPFVVSNAAVLQLLSDVLHGKRAPPMISITNAVAVQVYELVFVSACPLRSTKWSDLYIILASLALGSLVKVDSGRVDKLRKLLYETNRKKETGLIVDFRRSVKKRNETATYGMAGMSYDDARTHLLLRYDEQPLIFDFGGAPWSCASRWTVHPSPR